MSAQAGKAEKSRGTIAEYPNKGQNEGTSVSPAKRLTMLRHLGPYSPFNLLITHTTPPEHAKARRSPQAMAGHVKDWGALLTYKGRAHRA